MHNAHEIEVNTECYDRLYSLTGPNSDLLFLNLFVNPLLLLVEPLLRRSVPLLPCG